MRELTVRDPQGQPAHELGPMPVLKAACPRLGFQLTPSQLEQFQSYYLELVAWNQRVNLTTIAEPAQVQVLHFLDALTLALALPSVPSPGLLVLDVGSGNGLPGIALKIAFPQLRVGLLESTGKKARFLEHLVQHLGLSGVEVLRGRAEDLAHLPAYRERYDMVVARALAEMPALVELTLPYCRIGGCVVAMKQEPVQQEVHEAAKALSRLGGWIRQVLPVPVPELPRGRVLVLIDKIGPTPTVYPRRAGIPQKRPLR